MAFDKLSQCSGAWTVIMWLKFVFVKHTHLNTKWSIKNSDVLRYQLFSTTNTKSEQILFSEREREGSNAVIGQSIISAWQAISNLLHWQLYQQSFIKNRDRRKEITDICSLAFAQIINFKILNKKIMLLERHFSHVSDL